MAFTIILALLMLYATEPVILALFACGVVIVLTSLLEDMYG